MGSDGLQGETQKAPGSAGSHRRTRRLVRLLRAVAGLRDPGNGGARGRRAVIGLARRRRETHAEMLESVKNEIKTQFEDSRLEAIALVQAYLNGEMPAATHIINELRDDTENRETRSKMMAGILAAYAGACAMMYGSEALQLNDPWRVQPGAGLSAEMRADAFLANAILSDSTIASDLPGPLAYRAIPPLVQAIGIACRQIRPDDPASLLRGWLTKTEINWPEELL